MERETGFEPATFCLGSRRESCRHDLGEGRVISAVVTGVTVHALTASASRPLASWPSTGPASAGHSSRATSCYRRSSTSRRPLHRWLPSGVPAGVFPSREARARDLFMEARPLKPYRGTVPPAGGQFIHRAGGKEARHLVREGGHDDAAQQLRFDAQRPIDSTLWTATGADTAHQSCHRVGGRGAAGTSRSKLSSLQERRNAIREATSTDKAGCAFSPKRPGRYGPSLAIAC